MDRRILIKLFVSIWIVYLFHLGSIDNPGGRFNALTMSIVENRTLNVDRFKNEGLRDAFKHNGNYHINTNPGVSFLAAPFWAAVYPLYNVISDSSSLRNPSIHSKLSEIIGYAFTSSIFIAICSVISLAYVYSISRNKYRAFFSATLIAFGTICFRLSQGLNNNQNVVVSSICFILFSLIFRPKIFPEYIQERRFVVMGLMGGMGILVDLSMAPFLLITFVPAIQRASDEEKVTHLLVSGLIPLLVLAAYLQTVFGNPVLPPQAYAPSELHSGPGSGFVGATLPDSSVMVSHLVSLDKGLLVYMPFTIVLFWYWVAGWIELPGYRNFGNLCKYSILILSAYLLFAGSLESSKFNIFGPRYLLPAVPFLCASFALFLRRRHLSIAVPLVAASFYINIGGAQLGIGAPNAGFIAALYTLRGPWFPILDWIKQDLSSVMQIPEIITPYGLLILMITILASIWIPELQSLDPDDRTNT